MIFLELTDSRDLPFMINPSAIAYISNHGNNACIVLKSGDSIKTKSDYETVKQVLKRALKRRMQ